MRSLKCDESGCSVKESVVSDNLVKSSNDIDKSCVDQSHILNFLSVEDLKKGENNDNESNSYNSLRSCRKSLTRDWVKEMVSLTSSCSFLTNSMGEFVEQETIIFSTDSAVVSSVLQDPFGFSNDSSHSNNNSSHSSTYDENDDYKVCEKNSDSYKCSNSEDKISEVHKNDKNLIENNFVARDELKFESSKIYVDFQQSVISSDLEEPKTSCEGSIVISNDLSDTQSYENSIIFEKHEMDLSSVSSQDSEEISYRNDSSNEGSSIVFAEDLDVSDSSQDAEEISYETDSSNEGSIVFAEDLEDVSGKNLNFQKFETVAIVEKSMVFFENVSDEEDNSSECYFNEAELVTEENCLNRFSFYNKGTLKKVECHEFSDDDSEFELLYSSSLSSENLPGWSDIVKEGSELSQSYANEVFDSDFFETSSKPMSEALKKINEKWNDSMKEINEMPKELKITKTKRVCFASSPNFITVHEYVKSSEPFSYDVMALDRLRFQRRINEICALLTPILTLEHRESIMLRNSISFDPQ